MSHPVPPSSPFRIEVDVVLANTGGVVIIKDEAGSAFTINLDLLGQNVTLSSSADTVTVPMDLVTTSPYRVTLGVEGDLLTGRIESLAFWEQRRQSATRVSIAPFGSQLLLAVNEELLTLDQQGVATTVATLASPISELRLLDDDVGERFGVCMPDIHKVRIGVPTPVGTIRFPESLVIGSTLPGTDDGQLVYPTSLDSGPTGRIYVLDTGNSRVQVFDDRGTYITQWGGKGDDAGEFNFGTGEPTQELAQEGIEYLHLLGSIAVDDDGFIYVLDVPNRRIQKFAP